MCIRKYIHMGSQYIHENAKTQYKSQKENYPVYVVLDKTIQLLITI